MSSSDTPIFNYVIGIGTREFIITIFQGGMSQWEDLSGGCLPKGIHSDQANTSVVEVRISDEIELKARSMAEKEKAEELRTGQFASPVGEMAQDIAQMDRLMTEFFWNEVSAFFPNQSSS